MQPLIFIKSIVSKLFSSREFFQHYLPLYIFFLIAFFLKFSCGRQTFHTIKQSLTKIILFNIYLFVYLKIETWASSFSLMLSVSLICAILLNFPKQIHFNLEKKSRPRKRLPNPFRRELKENSSFFLLCEVPRLNRAMATVDFSVVASLSFKMFWLA